MSDQEIQQLVKRLTEAGIQLNACYEPIGCQFCLRPSDVLPYLKDRDGFFAGECGIEKSDYQAWKRFMAEGRPCGAPTAKGSCSRPAKASADLSPQEYVRRRDEGSLLCYSHLNGSKRA
ncbi:MAG TPA: hypothetical protein PLC54_04845 [Spirochaetales bacterium]|nr:hypothetical protein [Spirochaetales bacterium]